jgi:hypothetical protein
VVPYQFGMRTVLILPRQFDTYREANEQMDIDADYIHFKTKDLAAFLRDLV